MASQKTTSHIVHHWKEKGDTEYNLSNNFDAFICYWISLNAWYGENLYQNQYVQESKYIKGVIEELEEKEIDLDTEIESAQSLEPRLRNVKYQDNDPIIVIDIASLVWFIYTVRNNLFHGNKMDTDDRDKQVIDIGTPILKKILSLLI